MASLRCVKARQQNKIRPANFRYLRAETADHAVEFLLAKKSYEESGCTLGGVIIDK